MERFLDAVHAKDASAVAACFAPQARYRNMPHPPVVGPDGVRELFGPILRRSERVAWEIVSAAYTDDTAWLERIDRFWIDGRPYAIECNGVMRVDVDSGLITEFRDYLDLSVWRGRLGSVDLS